MLEQPLTAFQSFSKRVRSVREVDVLALSLVVCLRVCALLVYAVAALGKQPEDSDDGPNSMSAPRRVM